MRADTFEFFIVDDKDFGVASCIAFTVASLKGRKASRIALASTTWKVPCLVSIIGGMICINSV